MRRVAEHNDAQSDRELNDINPEHDFGPRPVPRVAYTVREDDNVDGQVSHHAPEAEGGHVVEVLEETTGQEDHPAQHHPGAGVDGPVGEGADHQVPAEHHVQDARHQ